MTGQLRDAPPAAEAAWRAAARWLASCPALPVPDIAVGDDGSVGLEWDRSPYFLYLCFDDQGVGELYLTGTGTFSVDIDDVFAHPELAASTARMIIEG